MDGHSRSLDRANGESDTDTLLILPRPSSPCLLFPLSPHPLVPSTWLLRMVTLHLV